MTSPAKLRKRCPSCGSSNPANATSCDMCGYVFEPSDGVTSKRAAALRPADSAPPTRPAQQTPPTSASERQMRMPNGETAAPPSANAQVAESAASAGEPPATPGAAVGASASSSVEAPSKSLAGAEVDEWAVEDNASSPTPTQSFGAHEPRRTAPAAGTEDRPRWQASAAYRTLPRPVTTARPLQPKATPSKRPTAFPATRPRRSPRWPIIAGAVLGVVALVALALAILSIGPDLRFGSAAVTATPMANAIPTTNVLPVATTAIATEAALPATATATATATSEPTPLPSPTALPTPTEAPTPQPTEAPITASNTITYVVKQGDTCWAIATQFNITVDELIRQNRLGDNCLIRPGQELSITR